MLAIVWARDYACQPCAFMRILLFFFPPMQSSLSCLPCALFCSSLCKVRSWVSDALSQALCNLSFWHSFTGLVQLEFLMLFHRPCATNSTAHYLILLILSNRHTDTQTKYRNPRCACAPRVNKKGKYCEFSLRGLTGQNNPNCFHLLNHPCHYLGGWSAVL